MNKPGIDPNAVLLKYGNALSAESIAMSEYPDDVKQALSSAAAGDDIRTKLWAIVLRASVPSGFLSSVIADDSPVATEIARTLGVEPLDLLASEEEARVVRTDEYQRPTLIYKARLRDKTADLLPAAGTAFAGGDVFLGPDDFGSGTTELVPGINPTLWRCYFVCALCAAMIVDPVPLDEVPACAACLAACASS